MKARLLIGVLTCAIMLAILATVGGVTRAHADSPGGLTCGGSVSYASGFFQAGVWNLDDIHNCNLDKTYAWELQYDTQANPLIWHDFGNEHIRHSADCTNGCSPSYSDNTTGCPTSGTIYKLRLHYWWSDGDRATASDTAHNVCVVGDLIQG